MWAILNNVLEAIKTAKESGYEPTADERQRFDAALRGDASSVLTVAGEIAEIEISGVLTSKPDIIAMLFGGGNTTYPDILAAINEAENNPEIERIILSIDSPGGEAMPMFDVMDAVRSAAKPVQAIGRNTVASAAFGIASQAGEVLAASRATRWGSIGVAMSAFLDENMIDITSTNAPRKRPDLSTEEGKAMVREELDALEDLFIEGVANGRGVNIDKVKSDFGQGGMLLSSVAVQRGMIDGMAGSGLPAAPRSASSSTATRGGNLPEAKTMDLKTLQAQHPDVFNAAVDMGKQQAQAEERDRVSAHLEMGEASGDMKTALAAIESGDELTSKYIAKYQSAAMKNAKLQARADDDEEPAAAGDTVATSEEEKAKSASDAVLKAASDHLGVDMKSPAVEA